MKCGNCGRNLKSGDSFWIVCGKFLCRECWRADYGERPWLEMLRDGPPIQGLCEWDAERAAEA